MKKVIRITESKLNKMIVESVKRILKEDFNSEEASDTNETYRNNEDGSDDPIIEDMYDELDNVDDLAQSMLDHMNDNTEHTFVIPNNQYEIMFGLGSIYVYREDMKNIKCQTTPSENDLFVHLNPTLENIKSYLNQAINIE